METNGQDHWSNSIRGALRCHKKKMRLEVQLISQRVNLTILTILTFADKNINKLKT